MPIGNCSIIPLAPAPPFRDRRSHVVRGVAVAHLDQGPEPLQVTRSMAWHSSHPVVPADPPWSRLYWSSVQAWSCSTTSGIRITFSSEGHPTERSYRSA